MTHPTKAIYKWLIQDSVRVSNTANSTTQPLYTEQDHLNTFPQIEAIDYYTTHTISSIRITPYPAGHVLGAAMFLIEIAGLNVFFTGDYSREEDRHLVSAEVPRGVKIDVLITESTYGIASHVPRVERENSLMKSITGILNRGGRALLPVFALGRAQELLLILDDFWSKHPEYQKYPIYYASNLARKCMVVYQTYIGAMNDNIKRLFRERMAEAEASGDKTATSGPWDFKHIRALKTLDRFDDVGGCVMMASPGMLQNGVSRELFERWAPSEKNGVVLTGYSVEGTMARQIMKGPSEVQAIMSRGMAGGRRAPGADSDGTMIPLRCSVQEYSFAAHVDGVENREFIEEVDAPVVVSTSTLSGSSLHFTNNNQILVHGEQNNMMRLKSKLMSVNVKKANGSKVFSPRNCEELRIPFKTDKTAKVVGKLATITPPQETTSEDEESADLNAPLVTGVLVQNDFKLSLMAPEDLREYAGLNTTTITCKQRLTLSAAGIDLIKWALEGTFGAVEELPEMRRAKDLQSNRENGIKEEGKQEEEEEADEEIINLVAAYLIMGCVTVRYSNNGQVELEWEGNMLNDGIADSVMAVLFSVESSPAAVKRSGANGHSHDHSPPPKLPAENPHSQLSAQDRLERFLWFLEAQFGADNVAPVADPKLPALATPTASEAGDAMAVEAVDGEKEADAETDDRKRKEIERLHKLGIPVPGIAVKVENMNATIWLEDMEVESNKPVFADRVRAVVERAVEVTAPLWA